MAARGAEHIADFLAEGATSPSTRVVLRRPTIVVACVYFVARVGLLLWEAHQIFQMRPTLGHRMTASTVLLMESAELRDSRRLLHVSVCLLHLAHLLDQGFKLAFHSLVLLANVVVALPEMSRLFLGKV